MKALRLRGDGPESMSGPALVIEDGPKPIRGNGEVLIQVCAAGITPTELGWYPTLHTPGGDPRKGAIPGHEFSGVIAETGPETPHLEIGSAVFGMNDWFQDGAFAEFCTAKADQVALKPASLSHAEAATVPISALTAMQGLFDRAHLAKGERVLIHGGSGAVGLFAVQMAHRTGAYVITTSSAAAIPLLRELGADNVIDYRSTRFEDVAGAVDIVFDTVGGETLERSWPLLGDPARMVTIASEGSRDPRAQKAFFIVDPKASQMEQVAAWLDEGELRAFVKRIFSMDNIAEAYKPGSGGYGKAALAMGACPENNKEQARRRDEPAAR